MHIGAKIIIDDYPYIYSAEDVRFIVEESAAAGKMVAAHAVTEQGARNAIEGGVASIEPGFEMSDELLTLAKKKGWRLAASGDGLFNEHGERIAGDTEESIYEALGLRYQRPEERG